MTKIFKAILLATAPVVALAAMPSVAFSQAAVNVGVANGEEALQRSNAFVLAVNQIKTTYKPQIDAFEARQKTLTAEIQPLVVAFQNAQKAPNPNRQALEAQVATIQGRQQAAQAELQRLSQPFARAQGYAEEQIAKQLEPALKAAMRKRNIGLVISPQATVSYQPSADITGDIVTELNALVPSVSIAVPATWQPNQQGGAAGGQAPASAVKPAPASTTKPTGR